MIKGYALTLRPGEMQRLPVNRYPSGVRQYYSPVLRAGAFSNF
ncbi:unnamed protein product [marine sediment metagenome]|uniref:Uncharacterized protein n=1 Tax=marine sediment metagenome TaxID=412755 RepID=X1FU56_9ZZZZ